MKSNHEISTTYGITVSKKVLSKDINWVLVTSAKTDWSGTYLVGSEKNSESSAKDIIFADFSEFSSGDVSGTKITVPSTNIISDNSDSYLADAITISPSSTTTGKYSIVGNDKYFGRNANSNGMDVLATTESYTSNYDNDISYTTDHVTIAGNGGRTFTYLSSNSNCLSI